MKDKAMLGEALEVLAEFEDDCLDFSVCDPPYGISFMGKKWDYNLPAVDVFKELLRVLKPGAHILIFGGTRTFHRMVCNIEDAGFEIRDTIAWHYGEGFPKNMDISKAIDNQAGEEREIIGKEKNYGKTKDNIFGDYEGKWNITKPSTDNAKKWEGYGTALKPATELITLCRKPISEKTIASNVLKHGTGALNIAGSRIGEKKEINEGREGRYPANVIFDEFAAAELDRQSENRKTGEITKPGKAINKNMLKGKKPFLTVSHPGEGRASRFFFISKASKAEKNFGCENLELETINDGRAKPIDNAYQRGKTQVNNFHPTVKPLTLIKYLVNLISFPGAWGIDLYAGSGTFALACKELFLHWTLIEQNPDYHKIIEARLRQGYLIDVVK